MRGTSLVFLLFLAMFILHYSRWVLPERVEFPAVLRLQSQLKTVAMADNSGNHGVYQFTDGSRIIDVIKMTEWVSGEKIFQESLSDQPVQSGECIKVIKMEGNYIHVERSWLSARHRILLHIPLHPDRMTPLDWETLPGIGPKLAAAIETDRQNNGDFNEFVTLKRVKGIGAKKLEAWQEYFAEKNEREQNR